MSKENFNFLEIIGILTLTFLLVFFVYIQIHKIICVNKGYSSADIDGCFVQINNQRIRNIPNLSTN